MKTWQLFREYLLRWRGPRMKAERTQHTLLPPFDVPMTEERIADRGKALASGWSFVTVPVAIRFQHRFATFQMAADFVSREVGSIAERFGATPIVKIDGSEVELILGVDAPQILTEGDFDVALALDEAVNKVIDGVAEDSSATTTVAVDEAAQAPERSNP